MMTTTFLTFLMSDNLFLHDVCSCFLVFVLKKCPVLPVSCEIKKRLIQMGGGGGGGGGGGERVDSKMQGQVLDSDFGKTVGGSL